MKKNITLIILFYLILNNVVFAANSSPIKRIEPPFWWVGMKNTELQIMLYGKDIANFNPSISYPNLTIKKIEKTNNVNYLFLYLTLNEKTLAGKVEITFELKGKSPIKIEYELKQREKNSSQLKGFDQSDIIYLITPDRFVNGKKENDNTPEMLEKINRKDKDGRHGGDIQGILNSLDYIKNLGMTAIWLNPVLENNQNVTSYHGYSTTDFYKVDPRYGSNEEYKNLVAEANKKGIKVIMDMIVNHCGSYHWWMSDLPDKDWLNYQEKYEITNHRKTLTQDLYSSEIDRKKFSDGWFVPSMPDLNQRNPHFATYLIQNTIWWIEYLKLAGVRMDTYPYPDKNFMAEWSCKVMTEYPNFNIVGEEWNYNPNIVAYWQRGKINRDGYKSCLPSLMDFPIHNALKNGLLEDEKPFASGIDELYEMVANDFIYSDPFNFVVFPDNHDMSRIFTQMNEDINLYKMALTFVFTFRGIPQIYYGTEILMKNPGTEDHGIIRSDFPGGWEKDSINAFKDINLTENQKEAKNFITKLSSIRKNNSALQIGKLMHFVPENGVYVYFRYYEDNKIMIILNKGGNTELDLSRFKEIIKTPKEIINLFTDKKTETVNKINIESKSANIFNIVYK